VFGGFVEVLAAAGDDAEKEEAVVDEAIVVMVGGGHAGGLELLRVGFALVAERIVLGCLDEGGA
jgi:hypothetical protein